MFNMSSPINYGFSVNRGLVRAWQVVRNPGWSRGAVLRDIQSKAKVDVTFTGGVSWGDGGRSGGDGCLVFDGAAGTYASFTSISLTDLTLECWLYPTALTTGITAPYRTVWGNSAFGNAIGISTAAIGFRAGNSLTNLVVTAFVTTKWQHFVVTRSGSTVTVYRNGISIGTMTNSNVLVINRIADHNSSSFDLSWSGRLDAFRIYGSRALSATEVMAAYVQGLSYYPLSMYRLGKLHFRGGYTAASPGTPGVFSPAYTMQNFNQMIVGMGS